MPAKTEKGDKAEKADKKPAEKKPAEKPAEKKPAEKKPAEKKPAEKKPADKKPADKKPAEKKPAEKKDKPASTDKKAKKSDEKKEKAEPGTTATTTTAVPPASSKRKKDGSKVKPKLPSTLAVGLKRGFSTKKRVRLSRPIDKKGVMSKRTKFIREIIREVTGFAPYERRIMELLRNSLDKRALRLAKKKLGTHNRGKRKREELQTVLQRARAAASAAAAAQATT